MELSKVKNSIKRHEGYRPNVYEDTLGIQTIGYGFTIKDLFLSKKVCDIILEEYVSLISNTMEGLSWFNELNQATKEVVVEMIFQLGFDGFRGFEKMIACLVKKDYLGASKEMLNSKWAKQTPKRAEWLAKVVRESK